MLETTVNRLMNALLVVACGVTVFMSLPNLRPSTLGSDLKLRVTATVEAPVVETHDLDALVEVSTASSARPQL